MEVKTHKVVSTFSETHFESRRFRIPFYNKNKTINVKNIAFKNFFLIIIIHPPLPISVLHTGFSQTSAGPFPKGPSVSLVTNFFSTEKGLRGKSLGRFGKIPYAVCGEEEEGGDGDEMM
jgi:hypothetical protein